MKHALCRVLVVGLILTAGVPPVSAQSRSEKKVIKRIKADIEYLASDELEGRKTDSEGERKAAAYLVSRYKKEKIAPYRTDYLHPFQFVYGKKIGDATSIVLAGTKLDLRKDAFPLPFSGKTAARLTGEVLPEVFEQGSVWMMPLYEEQAEATDAHFDYEKAMYEKAREAKKQGALGVIFYDNFGAKYQPVFNKLSDFEMLDLPVLFMSGDAFETYVRNREDGVSFDLNVEIEKSEFTGTNVAAYIDNKAPYTVVIGAHYDHLGFGDDAGSRHAGNDRQIHNGADDNASGTAGLLELATRIKKGKRNRNYNYLFVHFSGEELGLLGSKAFVKQMALDSSNLAYMVNMDMIGRLNDSTHALTLGGVGTSPAWAQFVGKSKEFKIVIDSSGAGPSDHTSFYNTGVPVLFFFTGIHHDYHKPSDDADKINYPGEVKILDFVYSIVELMDTRTKPLFTPTRQSAVGKVRFKVTLGIMPDYSFQEGGVRVDGVTEDRPAMRAGIKAGDIITQLGEFKINSIQSYMEALSKFKSGQTVTVTLTRNGKTMNMPLTF
ncbi:MAG: M28 family peptidase [Sphingobacteriales bacterium]|nr:MAG: M28 family peptidase [Sphingobacteriales bacterium]